MDETLETVDLNGEYRFKADAKGRVSLPAKFRKVLPSDLVVTPDPDETYLMVFTEPDFNKWVQELLDNASDAIKSDKRMVTRLRRGLKSKAYNVVVDTAGRIMIPADQRKTADIDKDVVIIGNTGYFEMWDAKRYEADCEEYDLSSLLD